MNESIDTDLATLRWYVSDDNDADLPDHADYTGALDRVEAELARLREQVKRLADDATGELMEELEKGHILQSTHDAIVGGMNEELARLRDELMEWRTSIATEALVERAEAAEARCARLQQALEWFADDANYDSNGPDHDSRVQAYGADRAREALAGPDTPADSQVVRGELVVNQDGNVVSSRVYDWGVDGD